MRSPKVHFHTPLAYTRENREAMRGVFEQQTGETAMDIRLTDTGSLRGNVAPGTVWGFHSDSAVLLFVVPK